MSGKDAIIEKIMSKADTRAQAIIGDAKTKAQETLQLTTDSIAKAESDFNEKNIEYRKEIIRRSVAGAQLSVKKYNLFLKRNAIEDCYNKAAYNLRKLNDKEYIELLSKIILRYAEKGEKLFISENDKKRVTEASLKSAMDKMDITFGGYSNEIEDGILLSTDIYDKTLTLMRLLELNRNETESKVNSLLFGTK